MAERQENWKDIKSLDSETLSEIKLHGQKLNGTAMDIQTLSWKMKPLDERKWKPAVADIETTAASQALALHAPLSMGCH